MSDPLRHPFESNISWADRVIRYALENRVVVLLLLIPVVCWGVLVSPFDWNLGGPLRAPIPVDAIPDIGENQQIVFTEWPGRSPQDVEDQVTYPLTVSLLGISGVKTIRSLSMFGFSTVYVIFKDEVEFYWSRSRILERLNSLPQGTLPEGAQPTLGPDATGMGQVFWYLLEGQDRQGNPTGGWDLQELRTIQDWYVRFALLSAEGVSEVASVGGFVREYQVELDPDLMRAQEVTLNDVIAAVKEANRDVGARSMEVNRVEYVIRGIGFVKAVSDIQDAVIKLNEGVPVFVRNVARVTMGPASRSGALDKGGAEVVGGVVVVRYGENPLEVIKNVRKRMEEISVGLPRKTLPDGRVSQVRIVPFYDRTGLIHETLETLSSALTDEILVTILVLVFMASHWGGSLLISSVLPLAIIICFIFMKLFGVAANVVALSGIAIAIGTLVDMGIIIVENILQHLREADTEEDRLQVIFRACREVGGAVLTAVSATIVSFLPVLTMEGAEGKLFRPLAYTKTFALFAALIVAVAVIPPLARAVFAKKEGRGRRLWPLHEGMIYLGVAVGLAFKWWVGLGLALVGLYNLLASRLKGRAAWWVRLVGRWLALCGITILLASHWLPVGVEKGGILNFLFVAVLLGGILAFFKVFQANYPRILLWCLSHKGVFLSLPAAILILGLTIWLGFGSLVAWLPKGITERGPLASASRLFPGLREEFMPPLDEGSYLFMPSTLPHASIGETLDVLQRQDAAIQAIPEVESVVGKLGRAQSALDPAPASMIETVVNYRPKYLLGPDGQRLRFRFKADELDLFRREDGTPVSAPDGRPYLVKGRFVRDEGNRLIPDGRGHPFRVWRPPLDPALNPGRRPWKGVDRPDDIWDAIVEAANIPGTTTPSRLQPISARMVMLQSGIRSSMGIRVVGPDLESVGRASLQIEGYLREIPSIDPSTVIAERVMGKPYIEIHVDRQAIAQYGIRLQQVQDVIEYAVGGAAITSTVEGRERYPVRVRYARELRDDLESLGRILVPSADGTQIPLAQLSEIRYVRGPEVIRGENTFLAAYVLFDKRQGFSEVDVVEQARDHLRERLETMGTLPAGVSFDFVGTYENQVRAKKRLSVILPLALLIIFVILYLQFKSLSTTSLVFSGIPVAWAGGFILIWLYAQPWFLDFHVFGASLRELFQVHAVNLSVAVWVGFLALFGVATDDGVVMATYLEQNIARLRPKTISGIRDAVISGALRRVRPCLMTVATTIIALIPVMTSGGRGSEIMVPMAIPSFGGLTIEVISMLIVPVLYCAVKERQLTGRKKEGESTV